MDVNSAHETDGGDTTSNIDDSDSEWDGASDSGSSYDCSETESASMGDDSAVSGTDEDRSDEGKPAGKTPSVPRPDLSVLLLQCRWSPKTTGP